RERIERVDGDGVHSLGRRQRVGRRCRRTVGRRLLSLLQSERERHVFLCGRMNEWTCGRFQESGSRRVEEKNPRLAVEVISRLKSQQKDWRLVFVGDGPQRAELEREAQVLGVADRVQFLGTRSDVPALLAAADLLLLPSRTEGMPAVVIEAGLAEVPAVAYAVGDVAEVVESGSTGVLAQPGNVLEFQQAVLTAAQDPERLRTMGIAARQRYARRFDIRTVARQYQETMFRLLENAENISLATGNGGY
ncbi:MAG: glycosyltransferase, partial [Dehalococcoidia bacterium]